MPRWAEANPLVQTFNDVEAIAAKVALVVLVLSVGIVLQATHRPALRDGLYLICALAGAFGAGANASVLLAL